MKQKKNNKQPMELAIWITGYWNQWNNYIIKFRYNNTKLKNI